MCVCVCNSMSVCMESDAKQDLKLIELDTINYPIQFFFVFF